MGALRARVLVGRGTLGGVAYDWDNPDRPWIVKLKRAQVHIDGLAALIDDFMPTAYALDYERSDGNETHVRITHAAPVPAEISAVLGDAVHNLRSALEAVAYELACVSNGGSLSSQQEKWTAFPIETSAAGYGRFFADRQRKGLFDDRAQEAILAAAPGRPYEDAARIKYVAGSTYETETKLDLLWVLHQLSVIDKHRRLSVVNWWPNDNIWWFSRDESEPPGWRWGTPPFTTGRVLGTFIGGTVPQRDDLTAALELRIDEPVFPSGPRPVIKVLNGIMFRINVALHRIWFHY